MGLEARAKGSNMGSVKGFNTNVIEKIFKDIDALAKKGHIEDHSSEGLFMGPTRDHVNTEWEVTGKGEVLVEINEDGARARLPMVFVDGEICINCKLTIPQAEALLNLLKTFTKTGVKPCK